MANINRIRLFFSRIFLLLLLTTLLLTSCRKEEEVPITLTLGVTEIVFDTPQAQEKAISIQTNSPRVVFKIPQEDKTWCRAVLLDETILIRITKNESLKPFRTTTITLLPGGDGMPQTIKVSQAGDNKFIHSFLFPADINPLTADIPGVIDHQARTVTISTKQWIGNARNMIARFETAGKLFIGDKELESAVTSFSIFEKQHLTVRAEGNSATYERS